MRERRYKRVEEGKEERREDGRKGEKVQRRVREGG